MNLEEKSKAAVATLTRLLAEGELQNIPGHRRPKCVHVEVCSP
eukprot:CAMPEP_0179085728 /NCGR_PEP_ID=MMETSP0796-20121207/38842_1 /TAXON_ID=73915 /ORGANISM="Pyrodinium bahamense, Strain pbaha01" /LENGTH=42 /DNA_ID= /DNA_START= /DNA_END= /DNA_ORIENTATION=